MDEINRRDEFLEQERKDKAINDANDLRSGLIDDRREILSRMVLQPSPRKLTMQKLKEVQEAIDLLSKVIDAEAAKR